MVVDPLRLYDCCLITDGAFEERGGDLRFLPAATPTPERMTAVLAQVHKVVAAVAEDDDLDLDPALAACVQLGLSGPHLAPPPEPVWQPLPGSAIDAARRAPRTV